MTTSAGKKFPRPCPGPDTKQMCTDLSEWGAELEAWGVRVQTEIKKLHDAVCALERQVYYGVTINKGTICNKSGEIDPHPPTDPVGPPPKPPF